MLIDLPPFVLLFIGGLLAAVTRGTVRQAIMVVVPILGGVNPDTGYTYGFNPSTGAADMGRTTEESEVFAGILQSLGVDTAPANLPDVRAMRRG